MSEFDLGYSMCAAIDKGARQAAPEAPVLYVRQIDLDNKSTGKGVLTAKYADGDWSVPLYATPAATTASASTELILPPLPAPSARLYEQNGYRRASVLPGPGDALYTAEQVRQAQRDAYELGQQSQKARIMHLTHERDMARACIDGRTAGTAPEGWKLVPVEPTIAMIAALGWEGDEMLAIGHGLISQGIADQYKAALAAAPSIATKETP